VKVAESTGDGGFARDDKLLLVRDGPPDNSSIFPGWPLCEANRFDRHVILLYMLSNAALRYLFFT